MENTQENKERFFVNYWGQEVLNTNQDDGEGIRITDVSYGELLFGIDSYSLNLKDLKNISDKDLIKVTELFYRVDTINDLPNKGYAISVVEDFVKSYFNIKGITSSVLEASKILGFLSSLSYLVPWMGLSPEEIIERGWASYE